MKKIHGIESIFGNGQTFYDEDGNMVGYSTMNLTLFSRMNWDSICVV